MRDILQNLLDGEAPPNPIEASRRAMRPQLRRRFYTLAQAAEHADGFRLELDGKPVRTPAGRILALPTRALAEGVAREWQDQPDFIDPAAMPLTRLANSIIDGVAPDPGPVAEEVARYLSSDLVFYRAGTPEGLVARQARYWDPLLAWAREEFGARFILAEGVIAVAQPEAALASAAARIPSDPWRLGAVSAVTTLTGSALIALALASGHIGAEEAWAAAHVDEDWNLDQWGRDDVASKLRSARRCEFDAAVAVLTLADRSRDA